MVERRDVKAQRHGPYCGDGARKRVGKGELRRRPGFIASQVGIYELVNRDKSLHLQSRLMGNLLHL